MAPKKRNICKSNPKNKRKNGINGNKDNEELNGISNDESNGLRRSQRHSNTKTTIPSKSKYFDSDSEESDDYLKEDNEFKPEVKSKPSLSKTIDSKKCKISKQLDSSSDEEEEEDWEEVKDNELAMDLDDYNPIIPSEGVEIQLKERDVKKKKKKCEDINDYIRQRINRFKRELQSNKHKTSLVLLISRAFYLNNSLNDDLIQGMALSVTSNEFKAPERLSIEFINQFVDWFTNSFTLKSNVSKKQDNELMTESLLRVLEERVARNSTEYNLTFLSLLRSLSENYISRLCYALNPITLKPNDLILNERQSETQKKWTKEKSKPNENNSKKSKPKRRKIVSSDSEDDIHLNSVQVWCEVYTESDRKWICVDMSNHLVDKPMEIAAKSLPQLSYVIGLDSEGYIREVTQRYANDWMSNDMKKRRTDPKWWALTLEPFLRSAKSAAEKVEDLEFETKTSSTPLPSKIGDYKNHPLYVLRKHLLKFQGIYPSDAPPLGFFKGEPVFARECVHLLRSRETWLRFARTVRSGETAYKLVKSRPKWDKYAKDWKKDLPLELFGEWQTDPYDPPQATDGKVPRNGYGNVDLFMPCMLPKGCVHLQLPGLLRIANKLDIDCSPAIVGFDNNGTVGCHPVMDGFVVCEEFKDILIAAWDEDQEITRQRESEKREKRVLGNWKKLIKGLIIREKVKIKYKSSEKSEESEGTDETDIDCD